MNVISPDLSANSFKSASGKKYIVYPSITTCRFEVLETLMVEMENLTSPSGFREESVAVYDLLNKGKFADAAVKQNNIINGVSRIQNGQPHPLLTICSLFICPAEENQAEWSEAEAQEKIKDWAGVEVDFFLASAKRFLRRYINDYATDSLNTLAIREVETREKEQHLTK